jgi:hypothetical protein
METQLIFGQAAEHQSQKRRQANMGAWIFKGRRTILWFQVAE